MGSVPMRLQPGKRVRAPRDELERRAREALDAQPALKAALPRAVALPKPYDRERERFRKRTRKPAWWYQPSVVKRPSPLSDEDRNAMKALIQHLAHIHRWGEWESDDERQQCLRAFDRVVGGPEKRLASALNRVAPGQLRLHLGAGRSAAEAASITLNAVSVKIGVAFTQRDHEKFRDLFARATPARGGGTSKRISVPRAIREFIDWRSERK